MTNPVYAFTPQDGIATLTVTSLADIKKLKIERTADGYGVQFGMSALQIDGINLVLDPATVKKVRFELKVGDLTSTQAEIDLGLNIGQVDKAVANASKDSAQTSWGALLKDQFHFVWVNGTPGEDSFNFQSSPVVSPAARALMTEYGRGIWVDLKTGNDTAVGSDFGDSFSISGTGFRRIDGGGNAGSPPWGGRATDSVDVFVSNSDMVRVDFTTEEGYSHKLLINNAPVALLKGIENVNIQIWNDLDKNGERDWGTEVQWVRNIQLAIQVNEVRLDPSDKTRTDWGQKLEDMGHLAWINGTKGEDLIDASALLSADNLTLLGQYKHGVWVDGAEGNDTITGTAYSDNIKGGAGVDKIDGGTHIAAAGQRGQDVFEIDLVADDLANAQTLLNTVTISVSDDKAYTWKVTTGTGAALQTDYIRNIEVVSVTVRDASNNWLTGKWVNTVLNVGEIRLDKGDPSKTEWGTKLSDQHHFAWVNGTSVDESFDYSGTNTAADTVTGPTKLLMDQYDRGMWVDTGAGNDTIVTSPFSDSIAIAGSGTKWVDAGDNLGKMPWGEKGRDEVEVFVASDADASNTQVVLLSAASTGGDKTAFDKGYAYKVQVGQDPVMAYLKGVERVNIQIWEDKNGDGQRQWDQNYELNEMTWVKQVPLAVQVNEIRVSASKDDETEWGQKLTDMYHMAWINGTDQSDTIEAPSLLSDATKALQLKYARGISIDAGAGSDYITATGYGDNIRGGWGSDVVRGGLQMAPAGERAQDVFDIQLWANNETDAKALLQRVKLEPVTPTDNQTGFEWKVTSPGADGLDEVDYLQGIEVVNVFVNDPINNQWLAGRWQPIALSVGEIRIDRTDPTKTEWGRKLSEQYHYAWVNGTNVSEKFDFDGLVVGAETVTLATKALMVRDQRGLWVDMAGGDDQIKTSPFGDNLAISGPGVRWIDGGEQRGIDPWGNAPKDILDVYVKSQADATAVKLLATDAVKDKDAWDKGYTAKVVLRDAVLAYLKNIEVVNVQIWNDQNGDDLRQWEQDTFTWFARLTVDVHEVRISATDPTKTDWGTPLKEQWHLAWINGTEQGERIDASSLVSSGTAALQATHKRGLWIHAGDGNDTITGTAYSDDVDGGLGNDLADGGGHTAPVGEQGRDTYQFRIEIAAAANPTETAQAAQAALARLSVSRVTTQDTKDAGFGYQWQIAFGQPEDTDYQVDFVRNFESLSVSVNLKESGQWVAGYWKHLALTVGEIRLDKNNPNKTEWGSSIADQHHFAWVNGVDDSEVFDYNTQISAATKALMLQHGRGLWVETRGGNDVITGSPFGDNFNIVASDQGIQKIDGGAHGGKPLWGQPPADHLDVFVANAEQAKQVRVVPLAGSTQAADLAAVDVGYSLKVMLGKGINERTLAYLKDIERIGIQIWNDKDGNGQRDWPSEVEGVARYDLVVSVNYPNNRDTSNGTVWVNGTSAAETIDVQALINTLPTDADPAKNWRGTRLEVNINADQGEGGDTIIGSNNPDMITPGMGVNYIKGGAQTGNQTWNKFQATYDSLQLFAGHEGALWKSRKITELKPPQAADQSLDANAYRQGYKFKVDMSDPYSPDEQEVHYIQGVEQVAFKVRNDMNGDDIDEVFNQSFVNLETPDVSWTRGEKGSTTVPPAHFFISGSDFIKEVNASALIEQFIAARKAFPVSPTDLPADFQFSSIANESNSFGTSMALGGGDHRVTGTDFTDTVLLDPSGNSTVDGGGDVGYWKFAGAATGAQDTLRLVDRVDFTAALLPDSLVKLPLAGTKTTAFANNMTPSSTTDDVKNLAYTLSANDLIEQPVAVLVKPKSDRTNLPTNIEDLVKNVETATTLKALDDALEALLLVADLNYGMFLGVADLNGDKKIAYSSLALLNRETNAGGQLVLGANNTATVDPRDDLLASTRYNSGNYHLIKLSDWDGFGKRPLTELKDADAAVLRDVFPKTPASTEADRKLDLQAIAAYAKSEGITQTDFEFALVSYQYDYAKKDFSAVAGVTLLKDVEALQIRLWVDGNFDYRPGGPETSSNLGLYALKPNAYTVKPEDLGANTGAGKNYGGSLAGTSMAETLDLKKDYQSMLSANYQAQKLGFKVSDLFGKDTVIGSDFDDFFALSGQDDQIEGGAGSDRVAFWWKPSAKDGAASLKTVLVPGDSNADPAVQIVQTQNKKDTVLATLTQTAKGWSIKHNDLTFATGFGTSSTNFGEDVLTGVEELVVLLESSLKDATTGSIVIDTKGVTDTVPFVVKLAPTVDYPQGADASRTSVTFNGSMFADVIDAPALLKTLPSSSVARENWQGTTLSTNILLNGGGDRVIGTSNADIIVAAAGVNFIDGGANVGRTPWVPNWWTPLEKSYWGLEMSTDQLQIFIRNSQDADKVTIESLASMAVKNATDNQALAEGYTTKVVYNDAENSSVNYIKNVEYVGKRIWDDKNKNLVRDAGEVTNYAFTPVDDTIVNWRAGEIASPSVGPYYFDLTASEFVTTIHAPSLIDRFIANKKAFPVLKDDKLTLDLPADFDLGKVIDYNSAYGVFLNAGAGHHQITGTAGNDFIVVAANGSSVIDGGAHEGYYKYPLNTATGSTLAARDSVRITEETSDLSTASFDRLKYSLIKVSDWVQSQTVQGGSPASVKDVMNNSRTLGPLESDWIKSPSVSAVLAAQLGDNAANSTDFLLVKTSSSSDPDRVVLGMDLLKNIERIEWRFWNDVNGDGRQGGGTAGYWGEVTQTVALSLELKPNLTVLESADHAYARTAGLDYRAVSNGTSFRDNLNLQTELTKLNAAPTVNGTGVKFTDFGGNDVVTGSVGNDLFYLSGGDDTLDGGQGANDRALVYWAPNTTLGNAALSVIQTDTSIVFRQTQNSAVVDVLTLNKTVGNGGVSIWAVLQGTGSQIVGFSSTPSIGADQLMGFEQFIVAINTTGVDLTKVSLTGLSGASVTDGYLMVDLI